MSNLLIFEAGSIGNHLANETRKKLEVVEGTEELIFRSPIESMPVEVLPDTQSDVIASMEHQDFRTDQIYRDRQIVHDLGFEQENKQ